MIMHYKNFNISCLILIGFFALGTAYLWRGELVSAKTIDTKPKIELIKRSEFEIKKNPELEINSGENESNHQLTIPKNESPTTSLPTKIEGHQSPVTSLQNEPQDKTSNQEKALPKEINLDVPFTSQAPEKNWDQPWQDACEEAAILMLDAYYKDYNLSPLFARDEILKMVKWEEEKNWGGSIEIEKVEELVNSIFNLQSSIIIDPTIKQIKQSIANGNPVLAVADGKVLPNKHFQNDGPIYHALIIKGYTEDSFITNDPGTQFGENYTYTYEELMNSIRDWNGGNVKEGRKVVLVIE